MVPVSSHAKPLAKSSTFNLFASRKELLTDVISNSPLLEGLTFFATLMTLIRIKI